MNPPRLLETHGDPVGAIHGLLEGIWRQAALDGFLVPGDGVMGHGRTLRLLERPEQLREVNPFRPFMAHSLARMVPGALLAQAGQRLGVLLRPCDLRALVELTDHGGLAPDGLLTVCVDCLATLPAEDFRRQAARRSGAHDPAAEALRFARQGGIAPYRFRAACQMCLSPAATNADVNIQVLGLPVREAILVTPGEGAARHRLHLDDLTTGPAPDDLVAARAAGLARADARHGRARARVERALGGRLPDDVEAVATLLDGCATCRACLTECPALALEPLGYDADGRLRRADVARWLRDCVGCGMCEQACPAGLPLTAYFGHVHYQLGAEGDDPPAQPVRTPRPPA